MPSVFKAEDVEKFTQRIHSLTTESKPLWGKMDAAKMLAHCNVTYELLYENIHPKPNAVMGWILRAFVKNTVVNDQPFKRNSMTAPAFIIKSDKDFLAEKTRLLAYMQKTLELGEAHFEGRMSHSFGNLTAKEWNNMFHKHLEHHLGQFGV